MNLTTSKFSYSSYMVIKTIMQKIMYFQSKKHFHLTYWWSVLIFLLCVYVFVRVLFQFCHHETMNSFIFAYMHSFLFGLSSNHVVHNKRIHGHGLDFTICCCLFGIQRNYIRGWYYLHNFKLLISFYMSIKNYLDTVNLQYTKPCKQNATWQN